MVQPTFVELERAVLRLVFLLSSLVYVALVIYGLTVLDWPASTCSSASARTPATVGDSETSVGFSPVMPVLAASRAPLAPSGHGCPPYATKLEDVHTHLAFIDHMAEQFVLGLQNLEDTSAIAQEARRIRNTAKKARVHWHTIFPWMQSGIIK